MAFVFLASPNTGHENSGGRRSRLIRPKRLYVTPEFEAPEELSDLNSGGYQDSTTLEPGTTFYISDEDDQQEDNNNYDYNLNKKASFDSAYSSTQELKWPFESNFKNRRIANVCRDVKAFTDAVKMAIDDQNEPFSKYVNKNSICTVEQSTEDGPPVTNDIQILIDNHKRNSCKILIRTANWGVTHPSRKTLWQTIIKSQKTKTENTHSTQDYWNKVREIFGTTDLCDNGSTLPPFVDRDTANTFHLNDDGVKTCDRIMHVLAAMDNNLEYCPFIYPITALLLHYMDEESAFSCIDHMLQSKSVEFFLKKKLLSESIPKALLDLAKRHVSSSFNMLSKYKIPQEKISCGFDDWAVWITQHLKFHILLRVVDCYLNEGLKVFYRCALASFHMCMKAVARDCATGTALTSKGISPAAQIFYENLQMSPQQFIRHLFKIKKFQSKVIRQMIQMHGGKIVDRHLDRTLVTSEMPDDSPFQSMTPDEANKFSQAASLPELISLWRCLPDRFQLHLPKLIFTTQEDGSSLSTLYRRADFYEPLILLLKSSDGCVFGAYLSQHLGKRNEVDEYEHKQHFFGTGETFVFSLRPKFQIFKWVGIQMQKDNPDLVNIDRSLQMFVHADTEEVIVGGGGEGAALVIDSELSFGKTNTCFTFNNEPLSSSKHFKINVIEAFALEQ